MCSPNINKSFLKVSTLLILRHIVALGTKTEESSTQMCSTETGVITTPLCLQCMLAVLVLLENQELCTEFHRSSLELGKGIAPEMLIVLPVRERNEQARST